MGCCCKRGSVHTLLIHYHSGYLFNTMDYGIRWPSSDNNGGLNFHGMFMSTGLVFFQGEALISYRLYRYDTKLLSKFVHVVFHMLAMAFFSTALAAMILQKNAHGWSHFTSVHSWIGIAVMFVFVVQVCNTIENRNLAPIMAQIET
ncbi:unnamed protein product [Heligmosomoides polygyrus]|uniref:Cytochrome b561 domain-containing protein n=1 Tax=Heligmosomoides polygyrus TaxID=6339 RepID=A0A183GDL1_HELPZ|nr:unnamed protein product [Heligmosomoides polygyrus]